MTASQASITPDIERRVRDDPISRVYQAVRTHALRTRQAEVSLDSIRQLVAFDREINKVGAGGGRGSAPAARVRPGRERSACAWPLGPSGSPRPRLQPAHCNARDCDLLPSVAPLHD